MGRFDLCFGLPMSSLGAILMPVFNQWELKIGSLYVVLVEGFCEKRLMIWYK